jgi:hypothetical protein
MTLDLCREEGFFGEFRESYVTATEKVDTDLKHRIFTDRSAEERPLELVAGALFLLKNSKRNLAAD